MFWVLTFLIQSRLSDDSEKLTLGICQNLFNVLKSSHMKDVDQNCVLIFDKIAIKKCMDFHPKRQIIEGLKT